MTKQSYKTWFSGARHTPRRLRSRQNATHPYQDWFSKVDHQDVKYIHHLFTTSLQRSPETNQRRISETICSSGTILFPKHTTPLAYTIATVILKVLDGSACEHTGSMEEKIHVLLDRCLRKIWENGTTENMQRLDAMGQTLCDIAQLEDPHAYVHWAHKSLKAASKKGHLGVVRYLCNLDASRGIQPAVSGNVPLIEAAFNGHLDIVQYLCGLDLSRGVNPGAQDNLAIKWTALDEHLDVVKYLCGLDASRGVDPSAEDNQAMRWAARNGQLLVVKYLCGLDASRGVDPSARDNESVRWAAINGHLDVVKYLCGLDASRGVDPSAADNQAMREAAQNGHLDVVRFLTTVIGDDVAYRVLEHNANEGRVQTFVASLKGPSARNPLLALAQGAADKRHQPVVPYHEPTRTMKHSRD